MRKVKLECALTPAELERVNDDFRAQAGRYNLRYRCEDCIHVALPDLGCALGYPNEMLAKGPVRARDEDGLFVFCKDFELA